VNAPANAADADPVDVRYVVVLAEHVTLGLAVHAPSQFVTKTLSAEARVTVGERSVHVALIPRLVGSGEAIIRMVSPGAIRAAVAPLLIVFQRFAKLSPSAASLPPS
jgi:hypothetical protein